MRSSEGEEGGVDESTSSMIWVSVGYPPNLCGEGIYRGISISAGDRSAPIWVDVYVRHSLGLKVVVHHREGSRRGVSWEGEEEKGRFWFENHTRRIG